MFFYLCFCCRFYCYFHIYRVSSKRTEVPTVVYVLYVFTVYIVLSDSWGEPCIYSIYSNFSLSSIEIKLNSNDHFKLFWFLFFRTKQTIEVDICMIYYPIYCHFLIIHCSFISSFISRSSNTKKKKKKNEKQQTKQQTNPNQMRITLNGIVIWYVCFWCVNANRSRTRRKPKMIVMQRCFWRTWSEFQ